MRPVARAVVGLAALALAGCSTSGSGSILGVSNGSDRAGGTVPSPSLPVATGPASQAAAGASSAPAADPAKVDPCSLVTRAEADMITNVKVLAPVRALELCIFPTPTSGAVGQLEVFVGDGAKKIYDIDHTTLAHKFKDVPGVGDEAHLEAGAIFFRVGRTWYGLRLTRLDDVDTGPALRKLAATVVSRV